ncbi:MAG: hypothetical protein E4H36_03085 [Spirochaetales bacterium]|nr:MAG: hypothetical protein E4H36_03085 [Spirochaetales bacterium]
MSIRWGKKVTKVSQLDEAVSAGFDWVQLPLALITEAADKEFPQRKKQLLRSGIKFDVCSVDLPQDVRVTQKGFNTYIWLEYLKKAIQRITDLGCRTLSWSDGRARLLPVEGDIMGAKEQVLQFLFMLGEIAVNYGITILVEPLSPLRTNFLNSMEEIEEFLEPLGKENIMSMISTRELPEDFFSKEKLDRYKTLISLIRFEKPHVLEGTRRCPEKTDGYDYSVFVNALHGINYNGPVLLSEDAGKDGLMYCKALWGY